MNIGADFFERATEKYRQQLKSYGNGKRKTSEQVFQDIWDWSHQEAQRRCVSYYQKLKTYEEEREFHNSFEELMNSGAPFNKRPPRKSRKVRETLLEIERTALRKIQRVLKRHPEVLDSQPETTPASILSRKAWEQFERDVLRRHEHDNHD